MMIIGNEIDMWIVRKEYGVFIGVRDKNGEYSFGVKKELKETITSLFDNQDRHKYNFEFLLLSEKGVITDFCMRKL